MALVRACIPSAKFVCFRQKNGELTLLGLITAYNADHAIQLLRSKGLWAPVIISKEEFDRRQALAALVVQNQTAVQDSASE